MLLFDDLTKKRERVEELNQNIQFLEYHVSTDVGKGVEPSAEIVNKAMIEELKSTQKSINYIIEKIASKRLLV